MELIELWKQKQEAAMNARREKVLIEKITKLIERE